MTRPQKAFLFVGVALLALTAGLFFRSPPPPLEVPVPDPSATQVLDTPLATPAGGQARLADWKGKVLVVNFWATWCPPCLKEIPEFVRMQSELGGRGLQFVGVAVDDMDKVKAFVQQKGVNYPMLVGELDAMELGRKLGNSSGGLPYTVVFNRLGGAVQATLGGTTAERLTAVVEPLLSPACPANLRRFGGNGPQTRVPSGFRFDCHRPFEATMPTAWGLRVTGAISPGKRWTSHPNLPQTAPMLLETA